MSVWNKGGYLWSFSQGQHETCHLICLNCPLYLLLLQSRLPAPPSVHPSPPASPARSCPLLARTVNALFASTKRWTPSSTPAGTCVCATTAGSSWRGRSTPAARSAGGPSKMSSKHTGHNGPGVQTGATTTVTGCHPCLALRFGPTLWTGDQPVPHITVPINFWKKKKKPQTKPNQFWETLRCDDVETALFWPTESWCEPVL